MTSLGHNELINAVLVQRKDYALNEQEDFCQYFLPTCNTILENTMMQLSRKLVNQNEMLIESLC